MVNEGAFSVHSPDLARDFRRFDEECLVFVEALKVFRRVLFQVKG